MKKSFSLALSVLLLFYSLSGYGDGNTHNGNTLFTAPEHIFTTDWHDPDELDRVWKASIVVIPITPDQYLESRVDDLPVDRIGDAQYPTIILLHGCAGVGRDTYRRMEFFVKQGFATITPVSFARNKYPQSCDHIKKNGRLLSRHGSITPERRPLYHSAGQAFTLGGYR